MKVAILPTGRTEWAGLAAALGRLFTDHEFYCLPTSAEISSYPDDFPYPGFTSFRLTQGHEQEPPESASALVSRAAQEALGDRKRQAADLVLILDDVELPNMDQVHRVVAVMRAAVSKHLQGLARTGHAQKTTHVLSEKVSFHLVAQ